MAKLLVKEIKKRLRYLKGWEYLKGTLQRVYERDNFSNALSFVNAIGELAEKLNHHPDILLYDYKKVKVILTTHSAKGITEKDFALGKLIEGVSKAREPSSPDKRMWMQKSDTPKGS